MRAIFVFIGVALVLGVLLLVKQDDALTQFVARPSVRVSVAPPRHVAERLDVLAPEPSLPPDPKQAVGELAPPEDSPMRYAANTHTRAQTSDALPSAPMLPILSDEDRAEAREALAKLAQEDLPALQNYFAVYFANDDQIGDSDETYRANLVALADSAEITGSAPLRQLADTFGAPAPQP